MPMHSLSSSGPPVLTFASLPTDILLEIASYLPTSSLIPLRTLSSSLAGTFSPLVFRRVRLPLLPSSLAPTSKNVIDTLKAASKLPPTSAVFEYARHLTVWVPLCVEDIPMEQVQPLWRAIEQFSKVDGLKVACMARPRTEREAEATSFLASRSTSSVDVLGSTRRDKRGFVPSLIGRLRALGGFKDPPVRTLPKAVQWWERFVQPILAKADHSGDQARPSDRGTLGRSGVNFTSLDVEVPMPWLDLFIRPFRYIHTLRSLRIVLDPCYPQAISLSSNAAARSTISLNSTTIPTVMDDGGRFAFYRWWTDPLKEKSRAVRELLEMNRGVVEFEVLDRSVVDLIIRGGRYDLQDFLPVSPDVPPIALRSLTLHGVRPRIDGPSDTGSASVPSSTSTPGIDEATRARLPSPSQAYHHPERHLRALKQLSILSSSPAFNADSLYDTLTRLGATLEEITTHQVSRSLMAYLKSYEGLRVLELRDVVDPVGGARVHVHPAAPAQNPSLPSSLLTQVLPRHAKTLEVLDVCEGEERPLGRGSEWVVNERWGNALMNTGRASRSATTSKNGSAATETSRTAVNTLRLVASTSHPTLRESYQHALDTISGSLQAPHPQSSPPTTLELYTPLAHPQVLTTALQMATKTVHGFRRARIVEMEREAVEGLVLRKGSSVRRLVVGGEEYDAVPVRNGGDAGGWRFVSSRVD